MSGRVCMAYSPMTAMDEARMAAILEDDDGPDQSERINRLETANRSQ